MASKWSPSWPNFGQSWRYFNLQNAGFSWGLALGAYKPAKISQHKLNFSFYSHIAACGLGGDREALTITPLCAQGGLLKPSREFPHNKHSSQISPAQIAPSVPRDNLLKTSRGIPHNQQPPQISPAQMTPNEAKIERRQRMGEAIEF